MINYCQLHQDYEGYEGFEGHEGYDEVFEGYEGFDDIQILVELYLVELSYEESFSAANSNGRYFLYKSKGLNASSLLVIQQVPLALIKKVIKLLKFKSAVSWQ